MLVLKTTRRSNLSYYGRLKGSPIVVFGRSLGGAVSIALAEKFPEVVGAVIVENTFESIGRMVDVLMPYVRYLKALVLRIQWNSIDKIQQLRQPIMFISGSFSQD
jgi:hypothetical protein